MGLTEDQAVAWRALFFELARALKCLPSVSVGGNRHVLAAAEEAQAAREGERTFELRVQPWLLACFGQQVASDRNERSHRFLEEALELVQACGCTRHEAHQLVDYVFGRPAGEQHQEVGGVMLTLAALCLAHGIDMYSAGETELVRVWTKVDAIRQKQATKPKHSPLPGSTDSAAPQASAQSACSGQKPLDRDQVFDIAVEALGFNALDRDELEPVERIVRATERKHRIGVPPANATIDAAA